MAVILKLLPVQLLPSEWKHTQSGVEVGVCLFMSVCVQKHQKYNPGAIQH